MRQAIVTVFALLSLTVPCRAGDNAKPNTLTPKELADGWILLFDGETTFGWQGFKPKEPPKVVDGALVPTGESFCTTTRFLEFELRFQYKLDRGDFAVGTYSRADRTNNSITLLKLSKAADWTNVTVRLVNNRYVLVGPGNADDLFTMNDHAGAIFFTQKKEGHLAVRDVKLLPLGVKSIFNGKDLAGWKVFPGDKYKSKFTVTDKREINVRNGPGDLQTTGKYQNFVLQLECLSNGKHLNSGIFFRCRDNEYQNGYEAQIRNQFTAEPKQEYVIEEFHPITHLSQGKKKIKSTAVDYGTGAIYRRQPARKQMAKDGEWFAMTIVANRNHLSTWVNGIQVADWDDNRPATDNARTGCKLGAGHISIQGHDPTTNLSFRNLRIAELPKTTD